MKQKHFRLCVCILAALAGYFLLLGAALVALADLPGGDNLDARKTSQSLIRHNSHGARELDVQAHRDSLRQKPGSNTVADNSPNVCAPKFSSCLNGAELSADDARIGSLESLDEPVAPATNKPALGQTTAVFPAVIGIDEPRTGGVGEGQTALDGPSSTLPLTSGYSTAVEPSEALTDNFTPDPINIPLPSEAGLLAQIRPSDQPQMPEPIASQIPATTSRPPAGPDGPISIPEPSTLWLWESLAVLGMALKAAKSARQRRWSQTKTGADRNGKLM